MSKRRNPSLWGVKEAAKALGISEIAVNDVNLSSKF